MIIGKKLSQKGFLWFIATIFALIVGITAMVYAIEVKSVFLTVSVLCAFAVTLWLSAHYYNKMTVNADLLGTITKRKLYYYIIAGLFSLLSVILSIIYAITYKYWLLLFLVIVAMSGLGYGCYCIYKAYIRKK